MRIRTISILQTTFLLPLAAWVVLRNDTADFHSSDNAVIRMVQKDMLPETYRHTVSKGLEYLVKHQFKDGHWEADDGQHPVATTALAGLALLMERRQTKVDRPLKRGKYSDQTNKAADWLMDKSQRGRDGLIYSENPSETSRYMQGHGLATLFLAGVRKRETDGPRLKRLTDVLTPAARYTIKARTSQGGWYHTSKMEGHDLDTILATAIQIQALQAAENAGIPIPGEALNDAQEYLKMALRKHEKPEIGGKSLGRQADTAAALACRCLKGAVHG